MGGYEQVSFMHAWVKSAKMCWTRSTLVKMNEMRHAHQLLSSSYCIHVFIALYLSAFSDKYGFKLCTRQNDCHFGTANRLIAYIHQKPVHYCKFHIYYYIFFIQISLFESIRFQADRRLPTDYYFIFCLSQYTNMIKWFFARN